MTDFISELEDELLEAARRRTARGRARPRWMPPRPRLGVAPLATAVALVLLAVLVVLAVRGLDRSSPADEAPVPPGGMPVTLTAAVPAPACTDRALDSARLVGPGHFEMEVRVVRGVNLREGCQPPGGACLVSGSGPDHRVACFPAGDVALALFRPGLAYGLAPEGIARVRVEWDGGAATAEVMDGAYELRAPGLREGDQVGVTFERATVPDMCGPSQELRAAVPLLGATPSGEPPDVVAKVMEDAGTRGEWRAHARMTEGPNVLQIWVAPDMPCDNPRVDIERACLVLVGEDVNRGRVCAPARGIAERGDWFAFPAGERTGVAGMAPAGTARTATVLRGGQSTSVAIVGGVFATVLPPGEGEIEVRFADGPDPTIINGSPDEWLAHEVGERLPGGEAIVYFADREVEHTTVYYDHEDSRPVAEHISELLRVDRVEPMTDDVAERVVDGGIAVLVGRDMTRPRPQDVGVLEASGDVSAEEAERLRERLALGSALHLFPTDEDRARSVVRYARGWEGPAREIASRLGIDSIEPAGDVTPDERLGTPVVVVIGRDLAG